MSGQASIRQVSQSLETGDLVTLFTIDASPIGLHETFNFSKDGPVSFRGVTFVGVDVQADGFEWNGQGSLPQPKIRITNVGKVLVAAALATKDLVGAKLIRYRTYRRFLDDGDTPDGEAQYEPDIYTFEQKTGHDPTQFEFMLSAAMDQEGRQIPGRLVLRDTCLKRYRTWDTDTNAFDYAGVTCPYAGGGSFDRLGNVVPANQDVCGKRLSDCKKRFGANGVLPYGGFPGISRVRR